MSNTGRFQIPDSTIQDEAAELSATRVLGIVSNCWKVQLDEGQPLQDLIASAVQRGFRAVELRQGCLGEFELAVAEAASSAEARLRLAALSQQFPLVQFNLAVSLPYLDGRLCDRDPRFRGALAAAVALAPIGHPHLRLVDTDTRRPQLNATETSTAADLLSRMTRAMIDVDGQLSIEHAYQDWSVFWSIIERARQSLGTSAPHLKVCFDPCNLLLTEPLAAIPEIVNRMKPANVSMIHLKQRRSGQIQPDVTEGDLNWPVLVKSLIRNGHCSPWLFEVAPHAEMWANLQRSLRLLLDHEDE